MPDTHTYKKHRHPGVRPRKPGVYIIDYMNHEGQRRQKNFHGTETDAVRLRKQLLAKVDRIKSGLELPPEKHNGVLTFQELWQQFKCERELMVEAGSLTQATLNRYGDAIKALEKFDPGLMQCPLDKLQPSAFENFKIYRKNQGRSPAGINVNLRHLRALFNYAVNKEIIRKSPLIEVGFISVQPSDVRFLDDSELRRLKEVLENIDEDDPFQRDGRDLVLFYLYTGARSSEALYPTFTWDCVRSNSIQFPRTKKYKRRTIPKVDAVAEVLNSRRDIPGGPFKGIKDKFAVYTRVKYIMRRANIQNVSPHTLRKTAGAWYLMATGNIYATQQFLGHSSVNVTATYYAGLVQSFKKDYATQFENLMQNELQLGCNTEDKPR